LIYLLFYCFKTWLYLCKPKVFRKLSCWKKFLACSFHSIDTSSVVTQAVYASELTLNSSKFSRNCIIPNCYYEVIQLNVHEDGFYAFIIESAVMTYGYIYRASFNPLSPKMNIVEEYFSKHRCYKDYKLLVYLQKQTTYILVATTYNSNVTGSFSVFASGQSNVTFKRISVYIWEFFKTNNIKFIDTEDNS
jgi:hypothetical protein